MREEGRADAVVGTGLREQGADVGLHRSDAEVELAGDVGVAEEATTFGFLTDQKIRRAGFRRRAFSGTQYHSTTSRCAASTEALVVSA